MTLDRLSLMDELLLGIQGSLLNVVSPQLRAVTVDVDPKKPELSVVFFYDGAITDELFNIASIAATEIDIFSSDYTIVGDTAVRLDFPKEIPLRGRLAFLRKEANLPQIKKEPRAFLIPKGIRVLDIYLLEVQQALLGKVKPSLRKVLVKIDEDQKKLGIYFYYNGEISEEDFCLANAAIQEAKASFPAYRMEAQILRLDFPNPIPLEECTAAYWRQEIRYTQDGHPEFVVTP